MTIHSFELQKAVFSALNSGSITDASGSAITGVFDDVPTDTYALAKKRLLTIPVKIKIFLNTH